MKNNASKKGKISIEKNPASATKPYIIGGIVLVAIAVIVVFLATPVGEAIRIRGSTAQRVATQNIRFIGENCLNGIDDNGNGKIDGQDSTCRGRTCNSGQVWTWSYLPGELGYEGESTSTSNMISCCQPNQCAGYNGECIDYDQIMWTSTTQQPALICGDNGKWDTCYDPRSGGPERNSAGRLLYTHYPVGSREISDGGSRRCQNGAWLPVE